MATDLDISVSTKLNTFEVLLRFWTDEHVDVEIAFRLSFSFVAEHFKYFAFVEWKSTLQPLFILRRYSPENLLCYTVRVTMTIDSKKLGIYEK